MYVVIFRRKRQEDGELEEEVEVKKEPEPEAKKSSFEPVDFITGATNLFSNLSCYLSDDVHVSRCNRIKPKRYVVADDTEMPSEDLSRVQIDEFSRVELELAINRTRKLKSKTQRVNTIKDIAERVQVSYQDHSLIN